MVTLLRELLYGPPKEFAFVLNPGDAGLLASLDKLSAEQASARPDGRSSIAAHVDHLHYGLSLLNRWLAATEDRVQRGGLCGELDASGGERRCSGARSGRSWRRKRARG